jgi:hypothetical protein
VLPPMRAQTLAPPLSISPDFDLVSVLAKFTRNRNELSTID